MAIANFERSSEGSKSSAEILCIDTEKAVL